jgi:hypothetical protein
MTNTTSTPETSTTADTGSAAFSGTAAQPTLVLDAPRGDAQPTVPLEKSAAAAGTGTAGASTAAPSAPADYPVQNAGTGSSTPPVGGYSSNGSAGSSQGGSAGIDAHGGSPAYAPLPRTNALGIVTLVLGILGFGLVPVITGHIALGQIKRNREDGYGITLAGLILGYVTLAAWILIALFWVAAAFIAIFGALASSSY